MQSLLQLKLRTQTSVVKLRIKLANPHAMAEG
jgi:hypothetical protein